MTRYGTNELGQQGRGGKLITMVKYLVLNQHGRCARDCLFYENFFILTELTSAATVGSNKAVTPHTVDALTNHPTEGLLKQMLICESRPNE